ncbi:cytochrome P450 [Kibdelosporangium banguiense]|uniref:Cytochrome P450 n=1 Tax=Kibdelosporangium banguiense TaxID=1365924 RepID=A0ABS4TY93_9PSEU|nr:cytochrome P450 [Kibdelosporangium banguiense]MBP2329373.1 cytochrome P450 [Kibdelosporangium banguiense]
MSIPTDQTDLPVFPAARSRRCPFDPSEQYTAWRQADGLQQVRLHNGGTAWVVSRYEDVRAVLADPRISADARRFPALRTNAEGVPAAFPRMDGADHAAVRRMLAGDFTVKRVTAMRSHIEELANGFLDEMIGTGAPADLVRAYALPVPSLVISLLLGVPYDDHALFQSHSNTLISVTATADKKAAAHKALFGYLLDLVTHKEKNPGDDLISRLLTDRVATGELSREETAMNSMILLFAGHETTANMIGLSTLALLENPEQAARIRDTDDEGVMANAVEELLCYLTIVQDKIHRVATEDLTIGGHQVRAGDLLTVNLPATNRDPAFLDHPDVLDITRNTRGHLAFGHGPHQCLGQQLARAELQIALPALLRRLPGLRLAIPFEDIKFRHDMSAYGVHALPVTW